MKCNSFWAAVATALATLAIAVVPPQSAQAQTYSVLYSFHGKHGKNPEAGLIQDKKGNLYGTTVSGGNYKQGTVFELKSDGKEKLLYSFTGADGANPFAGLLRDSAGNLYGTTEEGGDLNCNSYWGCGTVFKVDRSGKETVLYNFTGGADGAKPNAGLVRDSAGNLYGTTQEGGTDGGTHGCGVVFKLDTTGAETVLHAFTGGADGDYPLAGLLRDSAGNLYGTTYFGGTHGYGVVFKLKANGKEKVLYSFTGAADGAEPYAGLVRDSAGNLYGTTQRGGTLSESCEDGCGVVFKLDTTGAETVLYSFTGGVDGACPDGGLVRDSAGNLYSTTLYGGAYGMGVAFRLDTTGAETVLHSFAGPWKGGPDGAGPVAGLLRDSAGNLYGTTGNGGAYGDGVVFKITPQ